MKCLSRSKSSVNSRLTDKVKGETCAELKGPKKSAGAPSLPSSISRQAAGQPKGHHNKENHHEQPQSTEALSDDEIILSSFNLAEDSGYLSLHTSHVEQGDADSTVVEPAELCTVQSQPGLSSGVPSDSKQSCLPVLRFQEEVCKELAKSYRKRQSYDWTVVSKLAENYGLQNVIGAKMGLDYVDVLCGLLKKDMKHILTRILSLLGECDLINFKKVSKTWQKIIQQDERAFQRCRRAEEVQRNAGRSERSLTRHFGINRMAFSCLQYVASSTPVHRFMEKKHLSQKDGALNQSKPSRFVEFHEATKSLKKHEALRCCRRCGSPARFDSDMQRALCMRASCAFDFCSLCQSGYHGSTPCQRGTIRSSPHCQTVPLAGTARSKRNIRRL